MKRTQKIDEIASLYGQIDRALTAIRGSRDNEHGLSARDVLSAVAKAAASGARVMQEAPHEVSKAYKYPVRYTTAVASRLDGTVTWEVVRRVSFGAPSSLASRVGHTPVEIFAGLAVTRDGLLSGDAFGLLRGKFVERYARSGKLIGWASPMPHDLWHRFGAWEHATTQQGCAQEIENKRATLANEARVKIITARDARRTRLLARVSHKLVATFDDARACGFCAAGITDWAAGRGIALDAEVPIAVLARDGDRRAQAVALLVARRALAVRP